MSAVNDTFRAGAGDATPPAAVKVWDLFVRVFHWSLVVLFAIAFVTGDEAERSHAAVGYAIAGLLAMRVLWGFIGPRHARFANFVRSPRVAIAHLRDLLSFRARRHLGHNPAGALIIVALILMLIGTSATGHLLMTDSYWGSHGLEEVHGAFATATVALITLHVLGVLVTSVLQRENLIKAMITGRKPMA